MSRGQAGELEDAAVGLGERAGAADVVQAGVVEGGLDDALARVDGLVVEVEARVAVEALGPLAEEQVLAPRLARR